MSGEKLPIVADEATGEVYADPSSRLPQPDKVTTDFLWKTIVVTCALLILFSGGALVVGMFVPMRGIVAVELVQGVFLVVFGFVAGLLSPSPSKR